MPTLHRTKFKFKNTNFEAITRYLYSIGWGVVLAPLDAENSCSYFLEEYNKAFESFVPLRKQKKRNYPVWINKKIKILPKEKRCLSLNLNQYKTTMLVAELKG